MKTKTRISTAGLYDLAADALDEPDGRATILTGETVLTGETRQIVRALYICTAAICERLEELADWAR